DACGDPTPYGPRCYGPMAVAIRAKPDNQPPPQPKPQFTARATVKFGAPSAEKTGPFLDALRNAGADNIGSADDMNPVIARVRATPGAAELAKVPPGAWDAAAKDAINAARGQATVLAQADGREVGEARQILFLARTVDSQGAAVTVA